LNLGKVFLAMKCRTAKLISPNVKWIVFRLNELMIMIKIGTKQIIY